MRANRLAAVAATILAIFAGAPSHAQSAAAAASSASAPRHRLDPGTPPLAARQAAQAERRAAAQSAAPTLNARAESRLRASFDAADRAHAGTLTRAQAQAGGFGYIAQHFDAIDTRHAGVVSFDDLKRYLQAHGARYIDR
jgi:hypothetical protein